MRNRKIINVVNSELREKRDRAILSADNRREKALTIPAVSEAVTAVSDARFDVARKEAKGEDVGAEMARLAKAEAALISEYKKHGIDDGQFTPRFSCPICHDTGIADNKFCKCFITKYYKLLRETIGIDAPPSFKFSDVDFSVIKDDKQRVYLKKLYSAFERYAEKYPNVNTLNAIVAGGTGVGKSFLMSCVANRLLERGFSVMYVSAVQLDKLMLSYHTSDMAVRGVYMDDVIDCDMLIIDDLGSEQKIRNVTDEYLLMILNAREIKHKPVFITTNLSENELKAAYPERIFSRLANKRTTTIREIIGNDLRLN